QGSRHRGCAASPAREPVHPACLGSAASAAGACVDGAGGRGPACRLSDSARGRRCLVTAPARDRRTRGGAHAMRAPQPSGWRQLLRRPAWLRALVAAGCALAILAVATFGIVQLVRHGILAWGWLLLL